MPSSSADDWSNYWQGRTAGESGAALVGAGIETDVELGAFWAGVFKDADRSAPVLDLACGAGSALKAAAAGGLSNLTGADISEGAIQALSAALPAARGVVCPADATPFDDASFAIVVSQFGFEYADPVKAAAEIARLLAPGGTFVSVAHMKDGGIYKEVAGKLDDCQAIAETGFVPLAKRLFEAVFAGEANDTPANRTAYDKAAKTFQAAEPALAALAGKQGGLAAHLHQGTRQLYERHTAYALEDCLNWLDGMQAELQAYTNRMRSMTEAALSASDCERILTVLSGGGCKIEQAEPILLGGEVAGWILRAGRPG